MSATYSIACKDCKKSLWVGQSPRTLYSGEPDTMEALKEFLFDHMNHNLEFGRDEHISREDGWK
jgi:hypothetical protein